MSLRTVFFQKWLWLTAFFLMVPLAVEAQKPSETKLYGQINKLGAIFLSAGVVPQSTQFPTPVLRVRLGSPAYYAGVQAGDHILSGNVGENHLNLKIQRGAQIFLTRLRAKTDNALTPFKPLQSNAPQQTLKMGLKDFDIAFIVDHSGSMSTPIPGTGKMRWQWIVKQLSDFCEEAEKRASSKFTLCIFNTAHKVWHDLSKNELVNILIQNVTTGDTDLAPAITRVFQDHSLSQSKKPLLLFVITDGQTLSSEVNTNLILEYALNNPKGKLMQVVCIQAGYSDEGAAFITALKRSCAAHGMSHAVHGLLFSDVSQNGLLPLVDKYLAEVNTASKKDVVTK